MRSVPRAVATGSRPSFRIEIAKIHARSLPLSVLTSIVKMLNEPNAAVSLADVTILIAGSEESCGELAAEFQRQNARVIILPSVELSLPSNSAALDEAITNLYGYDWIIFKSIPAVECFRRRLGQLGQQVSDLDTLRVCAIGKATLQRLEESQIHVDLCAENASREILKAFYDYLGDCESLRGLNILIPKATTARDSLSEVLEEAGARVDQVAAFGARDGGNELALVGALLAGGGIDALVFTDCQGVQAFADFFDSTDLPRVLAGTAVFCLEQSAAEAAAEFSLDAVTTASNLAVSAIVQALLAHPVC